MKEIKAEIKLGDCGKVLEDCRDATFDLIFTSPPYADSRKKTYGGIHPDKYVEWFLPRSEQFLRTLKPTGSFVLNIKEKVVDGERHTYVMELIVALRKQGWLWTEEYIWHKKNCYPGKWPNRFRDAWERCLHFTKSKNFKMNQKSVMVPMGDWANTRLKSLGENDVKRFDSQVGSGFGKNIAIGWSATRHTRQTCFIWPRSAAIKTIARHSRVLFLNGLSNFLRMKMIGF